ncbi:hypothetical protein [Nocardia concava]|uniref:hypothetical protein n=1 Tax=Nocardia concava TaxID=257281 RepID=UPI0012FCE50E|nr:hypothetical protein [Nocardia concava]
MDRAAEAMSNAHASLREGGVYVDVKANGQVIAISFDENIVPNGRYLGPLIARLINLAHDNAQADVEDVLRAVQADPRIEKIVEQFGDAPERSLPRPAVTEDPWEEDDDPYRRKSRIAAPDWDEDDHPLRPR